MRMVSGRILVSLGARRRGLRCEVVACRAGSQCKPRRSPAMSCVALLLAGWRAVFFSNVERILSGCSKPLCTPTARLSRGRA